MPAKPSGSVYERSDGRWCARVRTADGRRVSVELPDATDLESAKREALETKRVLHEAERGTPAPKPAGEPIEAWVERWFADRERRGLSSVEADRPRWSKWVAPSLRGSTVQAISKAQIEALVETLDGVIVDGAASWKTITNAWTLVVKAFDDACASKTLALRVRTDNPTAGVRGPERGGKPSKAVLAPSEAVALFRSSKVPLPMRRAVALLLYTGCRTSEMRGLRWSDVDLDGGTILVTEQLDRHGARRETKTKKVRRIPVEPALLPLLKVMHEEAHGVGHVVTFQLKKDAPKQLRAALVRAGVLRGELHAKGDRTRLAVRVHDLRASYCTWAAVRGDPAFRIAAVAGHTTLSTTTQYVSAAEMLRGTIKTPFPDLPPELLGTPPAGPPAPVARIGHGTDTAWGNDSKSLWVGRDSNPGENVGVSGGSPDDWTHPAQAEIRTLPDVSGTPPPGGRVEDVRMVLDGLLRLIGEAVQALDGGDVEGALRLVSAPR